MSYDRFVEPSPNVQINTEIHVVYLSEWWTVFCKVEESSREKYLFIN